MAVKKKSFEIQRWMWAAGIPSLLGVIILFSRTVVTFADMPKRVDTIEQYIMTQQESNRIQAAANALMNQQIQGQQQFQPTETEICVSMTWYEGKYWCWDERSQTWYQQGE